MCSSWHFWVDEKNLNWSLLQLRGGSRYSIAGASSDIKLVGNWASTTDTPKEKEQSTVSHYNEEKSFSRRVKIIHDVTIGEVRQ